MDTETAMDRIRRLFPTTDPTNTFSLADYLHAAASPAQAILVAVGLFFPEMKVVHGSVLLARAVETAEDCQRFISTLRSGMPRAQLEESFNMLEISYAFGSLREETVETDDEYLAEFVCRGWRVQLLNLYPEKKFDIRVVPAEESGSVAAVTFCER